VTEPAKLVFGNSSSAAPYWSKPELLAKLDKAVPRPPASGDLATDVLRGIREEVSANRNVKIALDVCVHCGACLDACPTYLTTGDIHNSPVGRADLVRSALRAQTLLGKWLGSWVRAKPLDEAGVRQLATYYYQCLECRRCGEICPFGLDQADVTRSVRSVLCDHGLISKYVGTVIETSERTGNNLGLPPAALRSTIEFCRDEIQEEKRIDVRFKIDEPAHAMLVPPSADFFLNLETLKGYMAFFHLAGLDYTFTTEHAELGNFGLFIGEKHMKHIGDHLIDVARKLDVRLVVAGECGHGWRALKQYVIPRLRENGIDSVHIFHLVIDAITKRSIQLDPALNGTTRYVYQDPCNYARAGDLVDEPRFILRHVTKNYIDSPHSRERTWCCGGGAGMLADELMPLRLAYAGLWFEDARAVGGEHIIRPCAICKAQLNATLPRFNKAAGTQLVYSGLMDLVYKALVAPSSPAPPSPVGQ
jgi:Fe-S oxidoreductase